MVVVRMAVPAGGKGVVQVKVEAAAAAKEVAAARAGEAAKDQAEVVVLV